MHAIRFLGTPYCSAWKYVIANQTLTISATMIDTVHDDELSARLWYEQNFPSVYFGNDASKGAVQRNFYARGWRPSGTGTSGASTSDSSYQTAAWYWSTTSVAAGKGSGSYFQTSGTLGLSSTNNTFAFPVRLFLDN